MNLVVFLLGVITLALSAKGKISQYFFGSLKIILYAYVAYIAGLYSEVALNALIYLPLNIMGFFMWRKASKSAETSVQGEDVTFRRLRVKSMLIIASSALVASVLYFLVLNALGSQAAFVGAFSTVAALTGQVLMMKRYVEQWIVWIVVNVCTISMWVMSALHAEPNWSMIILWSAYLIMSIYGYINWRKVAQEDRF